MPWLVLPCSFLYLDIVFRHGVLALYLWPSTTNCDRLRFSYTPAPHTPISALRLYETFEIKAFEIKAFEIKAFEISAKTSARGMLAIFVVVQKPRHAYLSDVGPLSLGPMWVH